MIVESVVPHAPTADPAVQGALRDKAIHYMPFATFTIGQTGNLRTIKMRMNKYGTITLGAIFGLLSGCATPPPIYSAPTTLVDKAFVKFDLSSSFPITLGQVAVFEGKSCEGQPPNLQRLFVQGRGNPLIQDVNLDGVWLAAGKSVNIAASAFTTGLHYCTANGKFSPRSGVN